MPVLTAVILAKNEENDIEATIQNARQCADEVLIVDSGSKDNTVKIALKNGARVVFRAWDNDFAAQRNYALSQTDADWVLYLDADEHLNKELVNAIKKVVAGASGTQKQYNLQRKSVAFGKKFSYGPLHPDWVPRLTGKFPFALSYSFSF